MRELTVALAGSLELTVRTAARMELAIGERLRLDIPAEEVAVWALAGARTAPGVASSS